MAWSESKAWLTGSDNQALYEDFLNETFGLNDLEQMEDAPQYRPGVTLTAGMVADYMSGQRT